MPEAQSPVILIVSPHAGAAAGATRLTEALGRAGVRVGRVEEVSRLDLDLPQGRAWNQAGYTAAVAAGGDGTVGAVASHLAGTELPLAILPLGTANDVARSLDVPLDLDAACAVVSGGTARPIDLGYVRPATTEPGALDALAAERLDGAAAPAAARVERLAGAGAYFMHALTLGLNVEFARLATDAARRQRWGGLTYLLSAVEALQRFRPVPIRLRLDGVVADDAVSSPATGDASCEIACDVTQVAAVVTPVFGGGMNLRLPGVELRDRLLDFVVIDALDADGLRGFVARVRDSLADAAAGGGAAIPTPGGPHDPEPRGLRRFKARAATIAAPEGLDVTLDGEMRARTPLEIRVAADALRVLLPAEPGEEDAGG